MPPESVSSDAPAPRRHGRGLILSVSIALLAALSAFAAAFLWGVTIPAGVLRTPLERILTGAFGTPTRIEGSLQVRTGVVASVSAEALVLADPLDPASAAFIR